VGAATHVVRRVRHADSERAAQQLKVRATSGVVAQEFKTGLWAKDGRTFINIRELLPDTTLVDVRLYELDENFRLRAMRRAERANWGRRHTGCCSRVTQTIIGDRGTRSTREPDQAMDVRRHPGSMLAVY
jgi:lipopolysaccharide export system permease protein